MTGKLKFLSLVVLSIFILSETGVLSKDSDKQDDEDKEESNGGKYQLFIFSFIQVFP